MFLASLFGSDNFHLRTSLGAEMFESHVPLRPILLLFGAASKLWKLFRWINPLSNQGKNWIEEWVCALRCYVASQVLFPALFRLLLSLGVFSLPFLSQSPIPQWSFGCFDPARGHLPRGDDTEAVQICDPRWKIPMELQQLFGTVWYTFPK